MLVIVIGALGGMFMSGIIGLFVGSVVLAVGYTLLHAWLASEDTLVAPELATASATEGPLDPQHPSAEADA